MTFKLRICALLFSATLLLSGCGQTEPPQNDKIKIAVSFKTLREEVWEIERIELLRLAQENNVELIYADAANDAFRQNDQIEDLLALEPDVLLIAPVNDRAAVKSVDIAKEVGIPVISYTDIVMSGKLDYIVTFDYRKIGATNAEKAVKARPTGNYVLLNGEYADSLSQDINKGYHEVLDSYVAQGQIHIAGDYYLDNWSPSEALSMMEKLLIEYDNDIQCVLCNNDCIASGAIQALKAQGLTGSVYVAGMDGEISALQRIIEGQQTSTVYTGHEPYANLVFRTALAVAEGRTPEGITDHRLIGQRQIPVILGDVIYVNKDNLQEELIASGLVSEQALYKEAG